MGCEVIEWINLAKDREKLQAFVNAVMSLRIQYYRVNNVVAEVLIALLEGLWS